MLNTSTRDTRIINAPGTHGRVSHFSPGAHASDMDVSPLLPRNSFSGGRDTCEVQPANGTCVCGGVLFPNPHGYLSCSACGLVAGDDEESRFVQYLHNPNLDSESRHVTSETWGAPIFYIPTKVKINGHHYNVRERGSSSARKMRILSMAANMLDFTTTARARAIHVQRKLHALFGFQFNMPEIVAVSLHVANIDLKLGIKSEQICNAVTQHAGTMKLRDFRRVMRRLHKARGLPKKYFQNLPAKVLIENFITCIPERLSPYKVMLDARKLAESSIDATIGLSPRGIAAACIYIAVNRKVSQCVLADAASITEVTIRNVINRLKERGVIE